MSKKRGTQLDDIIPKSNDEAINDMKYDIIYDGTSDEDTKGRRQFHNIGELKKTMQTADKLDKETLNGIVEEGYGIQKPEEVIEEPVRPKAKKSSKKHQEKFVSEDVEMVYQPPTNQPTNPPLDPAEQKNYKELYYKTLKTILIVLIVVVLGVMLYFFAKSKYKQYVYLNPEAPVDRFSSIDRQQQQPAPIQQQTLYQQPAPIQQQTLYQQPAPIQQQTLYQQPIIPQYPPLPEQPAPIQQPVIPQFTVNTSQGVNPTATKVVQTQSLSGGNKPIRLRDARGRFVKRL